jgi:hypothetical protein
MVPVNNDSEAPAKTAERICMSPDCIEPLGEGRPDKKFCGDGCRNVYNNWIKKKELGEIKNIDQSLKRNRRILKKLLGNADDVIATEKKLLREGFNFDFSTHVIISKKKSNTFIFSYNYGYHDLGNGKYKIVKSFYGDAMPE